MWGSGMLLTRSLEADCKVSPFVESAGRLLTVPVRRLVCGIIYWYLWTILIPRLRGYHLEEEVDVLKDGTSVTKLIKVKNQ